jgi:uracil-DNA glycosylase family 4
VVPGVGPQPAYGMIVGEAPGREDEKEGQPFVGRPGRLLDVALRAVGVIRSEVYITNVVKEISLDADGKIRAPTEEEVLEWSEILGNEILSTAPTAILALGRVATKSLTGIHPDNVPFGSKIGKVYTAWHPGDLLRRGYISGYFPPRASRYGYWLDQIRPWAEALR